MWLTQRAAVETLTVIVTTFSGQKRSGVWQKTAMFKGDVVGSASAAPAISRQAGLWWCRILGFPQSFRWGTAFSLLKPRRKLLLQSKKLRQTMQGRPQQHGRL